MKKFLGYMVVCCFFFLSVGSYATGQVSWFTDHNTIITKKQEDVVGKEIRDNKNAIRGGVDAISKGKDGDGISGVYYNADLTDNNTDNQTGLAWLRTTNYIRLLVNYALGLLGLIALVYLLYHGFVVLTAGDNEEKSSMGIKGIKYATIALMGLGTSWLLLSLVFWLLQYITKVG